MTFHNPTPSRFRAIYSHACPSPSQYYDLFLFPYHSHDFIPIPSHYPFLVRMSRTGRCKTVQGHNSVASLGLVSPGAATDGVTPIFRERTDDLFQSSSSAKWYPFLAVRLRLSTVLSKFRHIFLFHSGVTPLEGVTRGGPSSRPSSDATVKIHIHTAKMRQVM